MPTLRHFRIVFDPTRAADLPLILAELGSVRTDGTPGVLWAQTAVSAWTLKALPGVVAVTEETDSPADVPSDLAIQA